MVEEEIDEQFSELIREKMSDDEFWVWVRSWFDGDTICRIAEGWDTETKKETLNKYS